MPVVDLLRIELLYLDLETCTRCRGTDRSLGEALGQAAELFAATGVAVELERIQVTSAEQARELRFVSSPTIRVNGRDIALELRESACGSEPCTDGCGESIDCRVWVYDGKEHAVPPPALIVEAIERELYASEAMGSNPGPSAYQLPENLARFFAATDRSESQCCSIAEQESCCEQEAKAECCGSSPEGSCGCR